MARTIAEIYDEMIAEKANFGVLDGLQPTVDTTQSLLSDLTSTSKVAIWRLIFYIAAVAIWTHEKLFDSHKQEITDLIAAQRLGSLQWYVAQAKKYQHGDSLSWNDSTYRFEYIALNSDKQIISQAAAIEVGGKLVVKVAKNGTSGLVPLSSAEKTAFSEYMDKIKFAGTRVQVITEQADDLQLDMHVVYDPLVLSNTGESFENAGSFPVEAAVKNFIQYLPFNAALVINELEVAIKQVEGVNDVIIKDAQARFGSIPFQDILATDQEKYQSFSGYMSIDTLTISYYS